MPILDFPDPRTAPPEGILAIGGDLHPDSLLLAYQRGIFPWPIEDMELAWFSPDPRAVLVFQDLHLPKSLKKALKKNPFRCTLDYDFSQVIEACALQPRKGQDGTWITRELFEAYNEFHRLGHAHSVECWEGHELVGGVYGVSVGGCFSAESMFHRKSNASKFALLHLVEHLKSKGLEWIDIQMMTPHMKSLGAKEIPRDDYLELLQETQDKRFKLF